MDRRSLLSLTALAPMLALFKGAPAQAALPLDVVPKGTQGLRHALATVSVKVDLDELNDYLPRPVLQYRPDRKPLADMPMVRLFQAKVTRLTVAPDLSLPMEISVVTKDGREWGAREGYYTPAPPFDQLPADEPGSTRRFHNSERGSEYPCRTNIARVFQGDWPLLLRAIVSREGRDELAQQKEQTTYEEARVRMHARLDRSEIDYLSVQFFFWAAG